MESLVGRDAISSHFGGRGVLVTGAAGFIGRRLTAALVMAGAKVTILESPSANLTPLTRLLPRLAHHPVDIRDQAAVRRAVGASQPEYVFHLAAVGVTDPFLPLELALAVNLQGSINLFRACFVAPQAPQLAGRPVRLVNTGTPYEYGGESGGEPYPISPYAAAKAAAFAIARMFHRTENWPIVTVRPFQVYGPGQPQWALIPAAILAARAGQPFPMTGGEQKRDFLYVDDIVHGYLLAAVHGVDGRSYDLGWGKLHSLRETIGRLYAIMESKTRPLFGALPYRPGEIWQLQANTSAAIIDLNWRPQTTLEQGLALTIKSFQPDNFAYQRKIPV